jgi:hypothetical protein
MFALNSIIDEKVKWPSKNKFNCKRNKGEHEYLTPTIKYQPTVRYIYKAKNNILKSHNLENEEYLYTEVGTVLETVCKHCGHKVLSFLSEKIK